MNQTPEDDADVFDVFGARPERWPPDRRAVVEARLHDDPAARRAWTQAARLDAALDAYRVDDEPGRWDAVGEAILAEIATREDAEGWFFGPIGWPQRIGVASAVGLVATALLVFSTSVSGYYQAGIPNLLASTLWLGTY